MRYNALFSKFVIPAIGIGAVALVSVGAGLAQTSVTVINPYFLSPSPSTSCGTGGCLSSSFVYTSGITGWTEGAYADNSGFGQYQPNGDGSAAYQFTSQTTPDTIAGANGTTPLYINGTSTIGYVNYIYQDVVAQAGIVAGATYTLSIDIGTALGSTLTTPGVSTFGLGEASGPESYDSCGTAPVAGGFVTCTATFVAPASPSAGDLLITMGSQQDATTEFFDNVQLSYSTPSSVTPEPGTVFLAGGAFGFIAFLKYRRRTAR
jgi:hypothetical protein